MLAIADPVLDMLGIRHPGPLPLISAVEDGLPLHSLDRVAQAIAPSDTKFAFRIVLENELGRPVVEAILGRLQAGAVA